MLLFAAVFLFYCVVNIGSTTLDRKHVWSKTYLRWTQRLP